jgi:hypothetical protein
MAASNSPTLLSSEKTVAAAGTAETLHTGQRVTQVTIIAKVANTGQVYVGGSDVASTTNDGLDAGDSLEITANGWLDLKDVYIDADTNGEGVDFYAVKA